MRIGIQVEKSKPLRKLLSESLKTCAFPTSRKVRRNAEQEHRGVNREIFIELVTLDKKMLRLKNAGGCLSEADT
jgi:hypothetical protein